MRKPRPWTAALSVDYYLCVCIYILLLFAVSPWQIQHWGNVEWAHDYDMYELRARTAAGALFVQLSSESSTVKRKLLQDWVGMRMPGGNLCQNTQTKDYQQSKPQNSAIRMRAYPVNDGLIHCFVLKKSNQSICCGWQWWLLLPVICWKRQRHFTSAKQKHWPTICGGVYGSCQVSYPSL